MVGPLRDIDETPRRRDADSLKLEKVEALIVGVLFPKNGPGIALIVSSLQVDRGDTDPSFT